MYNVPLTVLKHHIVAPIFTLFKDNQWLSLAIDEAKKAQAINEVPVGAVLVNQDNQLLAIAHNQPITQNNPTAHAEVEVIKKAAKIINNYRLVNTCLYTTLEPCVMCTGAIIHARINRVVFAAKDIKSGACGSVYSLHNSPHLNHRFDCEFIENLEYIEQLKMFFRKRRAK